MLSKKKATYILWDLFLKGFLCPLACSRKGWSFFRLGSRCCGRRWGRNFFGLWIFLCFFGRVSKSWYNEWWENEKWFRIWGGWGINIGGNLIICYYYVCINNPRVNKIFRNFNHFKIFKISKYREQLNNLPSHFPINIPHFHPNINTAYLSILQFFTQPPMKKSEYFFLANASEI